MNTKTLKKRFETHFKMPVGQHQMPAHAERVMGETRYKNVSKFISVLLKDGIIKRYRLTARNNRSRILYCSRPLDEIDPYENAMAMFPDGYFCNYSSIYYHSLTNQVPKTLYICNETISERRSKVRDISDNDLRRAFIKPRRHTSCVFDITGYSIVVVDRERNSGHGVIKTLATSQLLPRKSRVTCMERALIDAVVAPHYNGGIASVYAHYKAAQRRANAAKLIELYKKLDFVYPYSQAIGFLLEKARMAKHAALVYREFPPKHIYYIDHNAKTSWRYDKKWKLHYPEGLVDED
ncbi:MAG: hypothetical protein AABY87_06970 [bacterium]